MSQQCQWWSTCMSQHPTINLAGIKNPIAILQWTRPFPVACTGWDLVRWDCFTQAHFVRPLQLRCLSKLNSCICPMCLHTICLCLMSTMFTQTVNGSFLQETRSEPHQYTGIHRAFQGILRNKHATNGGQWNIHTHPQLFPVHGTLSWYGGHLGSP